MGRLALEVDMSSHLGPENVWTNIYSQGPHRPSLVLKCLENICGTSVGQILGCGTDVEIEMLLRIQHALSSNRGTQGCHCSFRPGHVNDGLTELADATKHCPCELAAIRSPQLPNQNISKQSKTQQRRFDRDSIFANLNRSWMHLPFHVMPQCRNAIFVTLSEWLGSESHYAILTYLYYHTISHSCPRGGASAPELPVSSWGHRRSARL